jgi:hypothetical protein
MTRFTIACISVACMFSFVEISEAAGETPVVTSQPTMSSLKPGQSVLFNDNKCPAGQIAKYSKGQRRAQITRKCIKQ